MTALIKPGSHAHGSVRPFALRAHIDGVAAVDPRIAALRQQVETLEAELLERDEALAALASERDLARAEGEASGREAGLAEADARREEALALLEKTAASASKALGERLETMERLAALLARTCLDRLFGEAGARGKLVADLLRHQLERLRGAAIVEIEVAAQDFDADSVSSIASAGVRIVLADALDSGDCRIRLALGALEIGLDQQWGVLSGILDEIAAAPEDPA